MEDLKMFSSYEEWKNELPDLCCKYGGVGGNLHYHWYNCSGNNFEVKVFC